MLVCDGRKYKGEIVRILQIRRRKGRGGQRKKKKKKITRGEKERKLEVGREAVRWCRVASIESIR